tara:strand:- start:87 stop:407 length:321 start_codon:yes stop_codon:yes gene_type:complete
MKQVIIDQDIPLADNKRLIKKLYKVEKSKAFPEGLEFAFQFLYFRNDKWHQVARIDNQLHQGKPGVHIHTLQREPVMWEELSFEEAEERTIELGEQTVKNIIERSR